MKLPQNSTFFIRSSFIFTLLLSLLLNSQSALSASPPNNGEEVSIKKMLDSKDKSQQELEKSDYSEDYNVPKDDFERGQPRSAIGGYLRALRSGDLTLATNYLDYRNLSDKTLSVGKEELARQLGVVLNRTLWVDLNSISSRKEGRKNDNLPSYRELVGQVDYQGNNIDVLLQRVPRAQDKVKILENIKCYSRENSAFI